MDKAKDTIKDVGSDAKSEFENTKQSATNCRSWITNEILEPLKEMLKYHIPRDSSWIFDHPDPSNAIKDSIKPSMQSIDTSKPYWPGFILQTFNSTYFLLVDVPGIPTEDLSVALSGDNLVISASHDSCIEDENSDISLMENENSVCLHRSIQKAFHLPSDSQMESIQVNVKDGVLIVQIPRLAQELRSISIGNQGKLKRRLKKAVKSFSSAFGI